MKLSQYTIARAAGLASMAFAAAGCNDGPIAPDRAPEASAAVSIAGRVDRYIVLMKEGKAGAGDVSASALRADAASLGGRIERSHSEIGALQIRGLTPAAAARLASRPDVEAVAQDRTIRWLPPRDQRVRAIQRFPSTASQRGAFFFDRFQWNIRKIKAPPAWNVTPQGQGVTACILDTGVDPRHIDLAGKLDLDLGASFVANERADRDFNGHGTYMAGIATSNGLGIASVAPEARLCSVKVLDRTGSGTFGDVAAGIMYVGTAGQVDGGARVTVANMSLGALLPTDDREIQTLIRLMQRAVNFSTNKGVLFVASAGNQAANLNDPGITHIPSGLDNVLSVGATGPIGQRRFDRIASYSNVGREGTDVFAPGGEFAFSASVLEDLIIGVCSASIRLAGFEDCAEGDVYFLSAGTSQAAAHVTGEAAVIESERPGNQTPAQLTACIQNGADALPNPLLTANGRINVLRGQACGS